MVGHGGMMPRKKLGFGSGEQATDGCSVELYKQLPYQGELDCVRPFMPSGATVLELGCATGRLTCKLLEWGLDVMAVDNSPAMLAEVPNSANKLLANIETLNLGQTFDIVLLASHFINTANPTLRNAFLAASGRHVAENGIVLIQKYPPNFLATVEVGEMGQSGDISMFVEEVKRHDPAVEITLRYSNGRTNWHHTFTSQPLDEPTIHTLLTTNGLTFNQWHDPAKQWFSAKLQNSQN